MISTQDAQAGSASSAAHPDGVLKLTSNRRIVSVDIFRGLTILIMIFVNDLAGVQGLPWWTYHLPGNVNGMTYVDMVFPFFLFIIGISLPLAISHRLSKGDSMRQLWLHVIARSFALLVLGIALANFERLDAALSHVAPNVWLTSVLVGAILFWNVYPRSEKYKTLFSAMKLIGLLLMAGMFVIFRRVDAQGHAAWLDFGYWEILGIIGWTYLGVCILYIPTRRWRWAPLAWLVILAIFNSACSAKWIGLGKLPLHVWPWSNGSFCLMTFAGIVASTIFLGDTFSTTFKKKAILALGFAAVLFLCGWLLTPLGISKIRATPTWGLYSSGAATLCFLALYWICDIRGYKRWASLVHAGGANTLLTYLLPDLFFVTLGGLAVLNQWQFGWQGVVKSIIFTVFILLLSTALTKARVRMQL